MAIWNARRWEFYLGAAELGFLDGSNMVFQVLLSERRDDVPVVRDYVVDDERAMRAKGYLGRMPVHFAYGSNMSRALMREHCPQARALGTAVLDHHRFIVMAEGYASVVSRPGHAVHGVH
jgi:hypothetical protein